MGGGTLFILFIVCLFHCNCKILNFTHAVVGTRYKISALTWVQLSSGYAWIRGARQLKIHHGKRKFFQPEFLDPLSGNRQMNGKVKVVSKVSCQKAVEDLTSSSSCIGTQPIRDKYDLESSKSSDKMTKITRRMQKVYSTWSDHHIKQRNIIRPLMIAMWWISYKKSQFRLYTTNLSRKTMLAMGRLMAFNDFKWENQISVKDY